MAIVISGVNNNDKITASDGTIDLLSGVTYTSESTAPSFRIGSNIQLGNAGIITATSFSGNNVVANHFINVGSNIQLGNAGVATATTFVGNLTGNVNNTGNLLLQIGGSEKFRVGGSGQLGIGGANYGTSGQVLMSQGSGSAVQWASPVVAGSILQTVYNTTTSEGQTSSSSFQNWSGLATNITPLSSSSHLWIWINAIRLNVQQDSNEGRLRVTDGTNSTEIYRCVNYDSDNNYLSFNPCLNWYWPQTHTAGTQITLTPQLRNTNGSGNIIWGDNGDESYMIVQEIAR